jgi:hypothetical protein
VFKRIFWMGTGMAVGAGSAFWAKRKVGQTVEQYLPEQVAVRAATSARGLAGTVKAAASEGRDAMRSTEAELRARVEARTFVGPDRLTEPSPPPSAAPAPGPRRAGRHTSQAGGGPAARRRARR